MFWVITHGYNKYKKYVFEEYQQTCYTKNMMLESERMAKGYIKKKRTERYLVWN